MPNEQRSADKKSIAVSKRIFHMGSLKLLKARLTSHWQIFVTYVPRDKCLILNNTAKVNGHWLYNYNMFDGLQKGVKDI